MTENKRKRMYPPDGGLKEQVRPLSETFGLADFIKRLFKNK